MRTFFFGAATASHQVEGGNHNDWSEWEKKSAARLAATARQSPPAGGWPSYLLERRPNPLQEETIFQGRRAITTIVFGKILILQSRWATPPIVFPLSGPGLSRKKECLTAQRSRITAPWSARSASAGWNPLLRFGIGRCLYGSRGRAGCFVLDFLNTSAGMHGKWLRHWGKKQYFGSR